MRKASRSYRWGLSLLFVLTWLSIPQQTHADGGAPNLAYVSGTSTGISVIDVGQAKVTKTIAIVGDPHTILLSLDGRILYAAQPAAGQVSVIAAKTGQPICAAHLPGAPTLLALDQDSNTLFTAGSLDTHVNALDAATCAVRHTYETGSPVYGIALATSTGSALPNGKNSQLWVAGSSALTILDIDTGQTLGNVALPGGPQYLSIPPQGGMVYATTQQGSVEAVDIKTREVHLVLAGGTFGPMDYDALTGEVYVPDERHNLLDVLAPIDPGATTLPKEPNRVIHTGIPPTSVAITNDGLLGFVALRGGKVAMLDLLGRHFVYTVDVGGSPHFIITGLYPPSVDITPIKPHAQRGSSLGTIIIAIYALAAVLFLVLFLLLLQGYRRRKLSTRGKDTPARHY